MDFSSKFLGTYNSDSKKPWYLKTKGEKIEKKHRRRERERSRERKY